MTYAWFSKRRSTKGFDDLRRRARLGACAVESLEIRSLLSAFAPVPIARPILDPIALAVSPADGSAAPPATATTPFQMRHFYGADNIDFNGIPGTGAGETIAIVDAFGDPNAASDLHQFDLHYGLPDPPGFQVMDQVGGDNLPGGDLQDQFSWDAEQSLDVQWAHAIAPAASIVLVEANFPSFDDLTQAVRTAASLPKVVAVSMSWGGFESGISNEMSYDASFLTPAHHPGVTFLAATGDFGSPGTYPAFSPNVVAVGGTTIAFAPGSTDGAYGSETGWSFSGGGFSSVEPQPSFQSFITSDNTRAIPDVSMDADPMTGVAVYDSYDYGTSTPWAQYGGTSLGTPMWAALIAIADQGRASVGRSSLDGPTQTLPALYALPAADFHDVTTGTNSEFIALSGFDQVTGIGTPAAGTLVNDLAGVAPSAPQVAVSAAFGGLTLVQSPDHLYIDWSADSINGRMSGSILAGDTTGLIVNGDSANDPILLDNSNGNALPYRLSLQGNFTIYGISGAGLAERTIDINQGTTYINYALGEDPIASIAPALKTGYNRGTWTGTSTTTGAIVSSAARDNQAYMVGYADSADGRIPSQPRNTIELKYTLAGDTNLDGQVNSADLQALLFSLNRPGAWDQGDFTYDGHVNSADLQVLLFNLSHSPLDQNSTATARLNPVSSSAPATTPTPTPFHARPSWTRKSHR